MQLMDTRHPKRLTPPPRFHDGLHERLAEAGHSPEAAAALIDVDTAAFQWHRMAVKGEVPGRLLAELRLDLELSQFFSLTAILRIQAGIGRIAEPATIGLLAEEMNIDPSRASRIASDLIARGYLRREAAQEDGRKSILTLTPKADAAFTAYRDLKWRKLVQVFAGWTEDEILAFSTLFGRYTDGLRAIYHSDD